MKQNDFLIKFAIFGILLLFGFANCSESGKDTSDVTLLVALVTSSQSQKTELIPALSTLAVTGFNRPEAIGFNPVDSTLIVADSKNNQIKKIVDETSVSVLLDTNGLVDSPLVSPEAICVGTSGTTYIGNTGGNNIIRIANEGTASVYAGLHSESEGGSENGTISTTIAMFREPEGLACVGEDFLYISDTGNNQIRKIQSNTVSLFAGSTSGTSGFLDGNGSSALFNKPKGNAVDKSGNLYIVDSGNHVIRKITPSGDVTTFAGSVAGISGSSNGTGTDARFYKPYSLTIDENGNLYVADSSNHLIRKITPEQVVTTLVGSSGVAGSADGIGTSATLNDPRGITYDSVKKVIYISCAGDHLIRKLENF